MKPLLAADEKFRGRYSDKKPSFGIICMMASLCILFGANTVAVKTSLISFGAFTNAGIRFFIASIVIGGWARATGRPVFVKKKLWPYVLTLTLLFFFQISFVYIGMNKTLASRSSLIANLQPFFVLIFAHFFLKNDRITIKKAVGIISGFTGVVIMLSGNLLSSDNFLKGDIVKGDCLILCSVIIWAVNAVYTKRIIHKFRPYQLAVLPGLISSPFLILCGMILDKPMLKNIELYPLIALAYQSIITASIGYVLWITLLKKYGAVRLHSYIFLMPVSGVVFGGLLLNEPVAELSILLALFFIITGVIIVNSTPSS